MTSHVPSTESDQVVCKNLGIDKSLGIRLTDFQNLYT